MKLLVLACTVATLLGCAGAPPRPTRLAAGDYGAVQTHIARLIPYAMGKDKVAGLSIALVDDQRVVWAQGFGYADVEHQVPASADTLYRVGSISKLLTDTAALQLAEQGLLDMDQPLHTYLPHFAPLTRQPQAAITPRQLMTHHAGLPRDRLKGFQNAVPRPFAELVNDNPDEPLPYAPDQLFSYSNLGISLLGSVVQTLGGQVFSDHMRQAVLTPLGMVDSSFDTGPSPSARMAKGYRGRQVEPEMPLRDVPAGGLNSNVTDLSRFMAMVFADGASGGHQVLTPSTVAEMLRPQNAAVALDFNFRVGLGWMLSTLGSATLENAGTVAHHAGSLGMFRSQMYLLPEHKLGVVVLANSASAQDAVDHIATETLALALEAKTGLLRPERRKTQWSDQALAPAALQDFVGDYTTVVGLLRIRTDGKTLQAEALGHRFDLRPRSDGTLGLQYAMLGLIPMDLGALGDMGFDRRTVEGREVLVARAGAHTMLLGQRLGPAVSLGAWQQRLGDYEITNLEGDAQSIERIRLVEDQGLLIAELSAKDTPDKTLRTVLQPLNDNAVLALGPLADAGETIRVVRVHGEEHLAYSGYLARRKDR